MALFPMSSPSLIAALAIAVLSGCGSPSPVSPSTQMTPSVPAVSAAETGYARVMQAQTIDGTPIAEDRRATAMVVFASWCGPCRHELAELGELRTKYPGLRVIGLNAYEDYAEQSDELRLRKYIAENAPWLTLIVHADSDLLASFGKVPKIPTLFVYDEAGRVVAEFRRNKRSPPSREELDEAIARALQPASM